MILSWWAIAFIILAVASLCTGTINDSYVAPKIFAAIFGVVGVTIAVFGNIVVESTFIKFLSSSCIAIVFCAVVYLLGLLFYGMGED